MESKDLRNVGKKIIYETCRHPPPKVETAIRKDDYTNVKLLREDK